MERIAHGFIDAFNRRDVDGLIAFADPDIKFHPTVLVGDIRAYRGHEGLRRWVEDLSSAEAEHQVRVREVRPLDSVYFIVLSDVLLYGEVLGPSAMLGRLTATGEIGEAHAYLSDESMLATLERMRAERSGRT